VIWQAYDSLLDKEVALKMEKPDKARRILQNEYNFLRKLQGITTNHTQFTV
jgi:predicted Ser/Thr protein kinase